MTPVYGPMRNLKPEAVTAVAKIRPLAGLPDPSTPAPRRRRSVLCAALGSDAGSFTIDEVRWLAFRQMPTKASHPEFFAKLASASCALRPGVQIRADYVIDVCMSSWCRTCPFSAGDH